MHLSFILLASCASGVLAIANGTGTESPDFNRCYDEEIKTFNVGSQGSDLVCSRKDGSAILDPQGQPYATLKGCRSLCGDGYQLWPKSETGLRILWYITPIFLLAARYAYAPIGISNKIWTYIHLIGDPMDSLWSTLIRQEKARRNYHLALEIAPGVSREVAAIWTAYDLWWQDASETTEEELKKRVRSGVGLKHKNLEDTQLPEGLTFGEIYYIKKCALQLAKNRSTNLALSWIAIVIFLASLVSAYIRTATTQKTNQTSHTLAIVMLFSFLVFAVYVSGHVGNFARMRDAIHELQKLHEKCPKLFPPLEGDAVPEPEKEDEKFEHRFGKAAAYAGINHSWRPDKGLRRLTEADQSIWKFLGFSFLVVSIAWLFAFLLSYKTPRVGFGCRSLSWTVIYLAWIISAAFDVGCHLMGLPKSHRSYRLWWMWGSIPKDIFLTLSIMILVIVVQFGYFNSCQCRASNFFERTDPQSVCIDLGPVTKEQLYENWLMWLIFPVCGLIGILVLVFLAGHEGEGGRMLFYRTESDLVSEEKALDTMRRRLGMPFSDDKRDVSAEGGNEEELQPLHSA